MKIKRLLLIAPPAKTYAKDPDIDPMPPLGLAYIAAVAEGMGIEVKILDALVAGWETQIPVAEGLVRVGLSYEALMREVARFRPDMVGINCQFSRQHRIYDELFERIKSLDPAIVTVAGGAHATVCPEVVLSSPYCDYLLQGEAEATFPHLIAAIESGAGFSGIDGLGTRRDGRPIVTVKHNWIRDLDALPTPAYHLMDIAAYSKLEKSHGWRHARRFMPVITSRGCPARCTFCSAKCVWGKTPRFRSVPHIIAELRLLKERFGIQEIMFEDDNLTARPHRAKTLFRAMIEAGLGLVWDTPNGVGAWSLDEEMLSLMKASGCTRINFPIESGSQRVLDEVIRKPLKLARVRKLVRHCRRIGLDYSMFVVIGMPGETLAEMRSTFRFVAACGCYRPHISVATPYPGTRLFDICRKNGYFARPFNLDALFIRSFLIRTPEWGEAEIKRILVRGETYLLVQNLLHHPSELIRFIDRQIKRPERFLANIRRLLK